MARNRHYRTSVTRVLGIAGLIVTAVAAGPILPGSAAAQVRDSTITAGPATGAGELVTAGSPAPGFGPSAPASSGGESAESGTEARLPAHSNNVMSSTIGPAQAADRPTPSATQAVTTTPTAESTTTPTAESTTTPTAESTPTPQTSGPPPIEPAPVTHLTVPAIGVDAAVVPVDSRPTGKKNAWGGPIYSTIEFPVDKAVRQWVRRGDPNTLPAAEAAADPKAFDRVLLYGHASDIGHHLVFQDLASLKVDDTIVATTTLGTFTYRVTLVATKGKTNLDNLAALYDYPKDGAKEIALVACLPNTASNAVVIGTLTAASPITAAPKAASQTPAATPTR